CGNMEEPQKPQNQRMARGVAIAAEGLGVRHGGSSTRDEGRGASKRQKVETSKRQNKRTNSRLFSAFSAGGVGTAPENEKPRNSAKKAGLLIWEIVRWKERTVRW